MEKAKKLKVTAALAAIMQFEAENEAAAAASQAAPVALPAPAHAHPALPLWAMAGRQDSMFTRSLMQRRIGRAC